MYQPDPKEVGLDSVKIDLLQRKRLTASNAEAYKDIIKELEYDQLIHFKDGKYVPTQIGKVLLDFVNGVISFTKARRKLDVLAFAPFGNSDYKAEAKALSDVLFKYQLSDGMRHTRYSH